jgi:hypothetical protein
LHRRKKPGVKEPLPKRAKVSPAIVPPTPDAPIPSPIRDDIQMEENGDQFGSILETNPTTGATAKDGVQGGKASGSSRGSKVDISARSSIGSLYWKKQQNEIVQLITMQEDASNQLAARMNVFVERTAVLKKVCIPCSPRSPWQILIGNPSGCSYSNYIEYFLN